MEKSINKVELSGFAGINPEVRTLKNGNQMIRFSLATSTSYKNSNNEWIHDTTWHNVVMWDKLSEEGLEKIKKGTFVKLVGKIVYRQYADKNGVKQNVVEIRANSFDTVEIVKKAS
ncbi:MAG: single-stranded DNA-binding protein [Bacteroidota bacterium]